jgi:hypothetical protein
MTVVVLTKDVQDLGGTPYKGGSIVEVLIDQWRMPWVKGAKYLGLSSHQYRVPTLEEELTYLQTHEDAL